LDGARAQYERALAIRGDAILGYNHPDVAAIRARLGSVLETVQEPPP
jgi:hypothetical protein